MAASACLRAAQRLSSRLRKRALHGCHSAQQSPSEPRPDTAPPGRVGRPCPRPRRASWPGGWACKGKKESPTLVTKRVLRGRLSERHHRHGQAVGPARGRGRMGSRGAVQGAARVVARRAPRDTGLRAPPGSARHPAAPTPPRHPAAPTPPRHPAAPAAHQCARTARAAGSPASACAGERQSGRGGVQLLPRSVASNDDDRRLATPSPSPPLPHHT